MIRKVALILVGVCLSASAFADVGGRTRGAAPKQSSREILHARIFDFLADGEVRESEVKNAKGEMEMVFERKDTVVCTLTSIQASGKSSTESAKCTNSAGKSVQGPVAKEMIRLMPGDGTSAVTDGTISVVEKQKVICVAHQAPGADNSVKTTYNCL